MSLECKKEISIILHFMAEDYTKILGWLSFGIEYFSNGLKLIFLIILIFLFESKAFLIMKM